MRVLIEMHLVVFHYQKTLDDQELETILLNTTHVNLNQRVMALIMYFSIGNAYKINRFYATSSSACKQLAINISVTLRHTG